MFKKNDIIPIEDRLINLELVNAMKRLGNRHRGYKDVNTDDLSDISSKFKAMKFIALRAEKGAFVSSEDDEIILFSSEAHLKLAMMRYKDTHKNVPDFVPEAINFGELVSFINRPKGFTVVVDHEYLNYKFTIAPKTGHIKIGYQEKEQMQFAKG